METKGDFVFFIRAANDMDHIVPVIYKLGEVKPDTKIFVYLAEYLNDFEGDFRLKFLAERGVVIRHIIDAHGMSARTRRLYFAAIKSKKRLPELLARAYLRFSKGKRLESQWYADRFLADHPDLACILHDHNQPLYRTLTVRARAMNVATLALPHAADNFDNFLIGVNQIDPYKICDKSKEQYQVDRVIATSVHMRDHLVEKNYASSENVAILGSPRFCDEWQPILRRISPAKMKLPETADFKIAFMLPKRDKNSFEAECIRIVDMLSRIRNVQVAVKLHTRNERFCRFKAPNVRFYASEVSSHALIDWADVTLFSATSVIVDNIKQDKPVLFLRRTIANKIMFERYMKDWNIDCRDDLAQTIFRMQSGVQKRTYSPEERERLLTALIEPAGKDVLGLYIDEIFEVIARRQQQLLRKSA